MSPRRISSFVDALLSDRRPRHFKIRPADTSVMRVAIAMRARRSKDRSPEATFIDHLLQELVVQAHGTGHSPVGRAVRRRARFVVGAAAVLSTWGGPS